MPLNPNPSRADLTPIRLNPRERVRKLALAYGVTVADRPVCPGHSSPLDGLVAWIYDRPSLSLTIGPRGGGKSLLAGLATHIESQRYDRHGTKILGGSLLP